LYTDDLGESVFLATGQPGGELAVAQVGFIHGREYGVWFFLWQVRHAPACRVLTTIVFITTIKAPAFEGRGYTIVIVNSS
jgi:hypothetical protein